MANSELKTGNWFVDKLNYYQAANSDNESLKKNFVIRKAEFELIIEALRSKKADDPLQHELVLGRRGSGKSTLLKRIQIEIEEDAELSKKYITINLAEEQAGIYRLSDLWFEVWQELTNQLGISVSLLDFSTFKNDQEYTRYLFSEIHKALTKAHKKVVVLLDNLDRILENLDDDGNLLRELLLNYNDVQLIGGSTRMDEHFWQYDKPFYEFFRRHRLESLTFEEINLLLNHWSDAMGLPPLHGYAHQNRGKIEAIRILTDGLPRTLQFFIQILLHESDLYGFDYIRKVMDKATPLYQERLNSLTPAQRKIVLEMAFLWEACSTKQLVEKCRMEGKLISSYLKQLSNYGIIETIPTQTKNHLYRLSERFFNMWLIITQGNPEQKRKAMWLTIFLESWYDAADLKNLAQNYKQKLKEGEVAYDKANVLTKAFSQSRYITTLERDELIDLTTQLEKKMAGSSQILPKKFEEIYNEVLKLINAEKYELALQKADEIENEEDGVKFGLKANIYADLREIEEAENYYLLAIEKGDTGALFNLANLYREQEKLQEAENYYLLAIEKGNIRALFNLALMFHEHEKPQEAENYYRLAIEKGDIGALNNLANLYHNREKLQEAEKYYLLAIEKGNTLALFNLAFLYRNQEKPQEAEKYYLLAIEKGNSNALYNLAFLYFEENRQKSKALQYIIEYNQHYKDKDSSELEIIFLIWNGIFDNVDEKISSFFAEYGYEKLDWLLENLLYLEQKHLVLSLFESEQHGKELKDRYSLLYYATLILTNKSDNNLELRIPPEVQPTVQGIIEKVKEKNAFYAQ